MIRALKHCWKATASTKRQQNSSAESARMLFYAIYTCIPERREEFVTYIHILRVPMAMRSHESQFYFYIIYLSISLYAALSEPLLLHNERPFRLSHI